MGLFDKLFGGSPPKKQRTLYDDFKATAVPLVVNGYRRVAAERGCAPPQGDFVGTVYVSPYHRKNSNKAPKGFRIR
jgi:hypothetical protein